MILDDIEQQQQIICNGFSAKKKLIRKMNISVIIFYLKIILVFIKDNDLLEG